MCICIYYYYLAICLSLSLSIYIYIYIFIHACKATMSVASEAIGDPSPLMLATARVLESLPQVVHPDRKF